MREANIHFSLYTDREDAVSVWAPFQEKGGKLTYFRMALLSSRCFPAAVRSLDRRS